MKIIIHSHITLFLDEMPTGFLKKLVKVFTRKNPDKAIKQRMGFYTGNIPATIPLYKYEAYMGKAGFSIERGLWWLLTPYLKQYNIKPEFIDDREVNKIDFPEFKCTLEDYQDKAVKDIVDTECQGIINVNTGGGKTVIALGLMNALKQRTLVLVHKVDLVKQWKASLEKFFPGIDVKRYDNIKRQEGQHVTIATIQTLSRSNIDVLEGYGCVMLDEMHHVPANTFHKVVTKCPARYRYGFSATLNRKDGKQFMFDAIFGKVLVELDYRDTASRIILPDVYFHKVEMNSVDEMRKALKIEEKEEEEKRLKEFPKATPKIITADWTKVITCLSEDTVRNVYIGKLIIKLAEEKEASILVLVNRVEHAILLADSLKKCNINAYALHGSINNNLREEVLEKMRKKELQVLIGTSLADEGLDIPVLNRLVLCVPIANKDLLKQRIGRIIRKAKGKETPQIHDLVDIQFDKFKGMAKVRRGMYKKNRFNIVVDI